MQANATGTPSCDIFPKTKPRDSISSVEDCKKTKKKLTNSMGMLSEKEGEKEIVPLDHAPKIQIPIRPKPERAPRSANLKLREKEPSLKDNAN